MFGLLRRAARLTGARPGPPGRHMLKLGQNGRLAATRRKLDLFWNADMGGQTFSTT